MGDTAYDTVVALLAISEADAVALNAELVITKRAVDANAKRMDIYERRCAILEKALRWMCDKFGGQMEDGPYDPPPSNIEPTIRAVLKSFSTLGNPDHPEIIHDQTKDPERWS